MNFESWITWALQGLIGFLLWIIWQKLEENSRAISALALKISEDYMKKSDPFFTQFSLYHDRLRDVEEWMFGQKARELYGDRKEKKE